MCNNLYDDYTSNAINLIIIDELKVSFNHYTRIITLSFNLDNLPSISFTSMSFYTALQSN